MKLGVGREIVKTALPWAASRSAPAAIAALPLSVEPSPSLKSRQSACATRQGSAG